MAVLWMTEALPIYVTAMLPIILFPMMEVSRGVIFVFLGGMSVAMCIEKWNIHRRFALKLLLFLGTSTKWLTFGFMVTTGFMSMWVSNTATTSMMIPIGQTVLLDAESKNLCKLVCLCICYSANCGDIATLTGTTPNLVLKGQLDQYVSDAVPGMMIATSLFIFPSRRRLKTDTGEDETNEIPPLLDWQTFVEKIPWGVTLLQGGGLALAFACQESGLSLWLGAQMSVFRDVPVWIMIFIICTFVSLTTEVVSNIAACSIVLPVLANMAAGMHIHPTYLMLPATVACSFAFMLPVSTPPNIIAFSYGYLKVTDMMKIGVFVNFSCVIIVTVAINTYGAAFLNLHEYPDWKLLSDKTMNLNITNINSTLLQ
ncbi:Na(+)/citrate cotransporter-like [Mytilus californianus]|uniref:Na(+)/citrate cotransporter-like n=1 Tax=Mytilus californianus TaxID=6549 RepID=UPI002247F931|nr:Na(+)/citrate cotransporter-like [Mytilus californianus]